MIRIRFPYAATEQRALGFLAGRFSFRNWANGEILVPAAALASLASAGIPLSVCERAFPMGERIVVDPRICHGKPVVRGMRTPVTVILDALAGGDTFETIMEDYRITIDDVRDCIAFASEEVSRLNGR